MGREIWGWAGKFPEKTLEVNSLFGNFRDLVVGRKFPLSTPIIPDK
jgi:hypothetical protein